MSKRKPIPNDPVVVPLRANMPPQKKVGDVALARSKQKTQPVQPTFTLPEFPKMATPRFKADRLAQDSQIIEVNAWAQQNAYASAFNNGATFLGYPYLSQLSQIPEYRKVTETIAMHMTRKFIKMQSTGEGDDKTEKVKQITDALDNFKIRDVFRKAAEVDGYFGRAHLYIDLGYADPKELRMPIGTGRDALSKIKVPKGSVKGFKIIEPVWCYPTNYDSNNPLTGDWYNPQSWFVMQKEMHESRILRMVGREVPDLLKPAYSFGGLSLSQMIKPYVDNWLRTRQSVADLIWSFSVSGIKTDLSTSMTGDGQALYDRAELFNNLRNNRGMMLLDKEVEEFFQVATPLGTLDKLQAQAQEHMSSVSSIPLIFLLGITPSGLNASSEGEIRAFYDFINAFQEKFFKDPLTRVIDFIQLHLFGEVDPEITFVFEPLWSMTEKEVAEVDKITAETDSARIGDGIISPLEARKRVANAPETPYQGLDMTVIPVAPGSGDVDGDGEPDPEGAPPVGENGAVEGNDPGEVDVERDHPSSGEDDDIPFANDMALDADFKEGDHPRGQPGNAGQFGSSGGSASGGGSKPKVVEHLGSYAVEHNGAHVKNKLGNTKYFSSPEAAQKFADTYTGEPEAPKEKKAKKEPGFGAAPADDKYKKITTNEEFHEIVNSSSERDNLTSEDKAVLAQYTSPAYAPLNKALRGGKQLSPESQKMVAQLDKAINDAKLPTDLTLFRGLRGEKVRAMMDGLMPGDTLTDKGFVSTSLGEHVAKGQSESGKRTMMVIRAPKGTNAAFPGEHSYNAKPTQNGSRVDDGLEAILPRNSQFKFLGKKGATYEFELVHNKGAKDEAWSEAKHPRGQPGNAGQFGPGGGGSSGGASLATAKQVTSIINKAAGISGKYRQQIKNLLKDSSISKESKDKLTQKLIESYKAKANQLHKAGDTAKAAAVAEKAIKLSKMTGTYNVPIKESPKEDVIQLTNNKGEEVDAWGKSKSDYAKELAAEDPVAMGETQKFSDLEISQAKKSTSLPNYHDLKAVKEFNDKWSGKTPTEAQIVEKIADHKKMKEASSVEMQEKVAAEQKKADEANAKKKEEEKAYAEKLAKEMSDPEVAKHYAVLKSIAGGLTSERQKHLNNLITKAGLAHTGFNAVDCALVQAYTGSDYGPVNKQLRNGSLAKEQFGYAKSLQQALKKLPPFKGIVKRGTNLPEEVFKNYKPGYIVQERAFTSTGEGYKFSGTHTYEIESVSGRDVRRISSQGPGEEEVIFPANSHFEVISVQGKHIKMRQVEDIL